MLLGWSPKEKKSKKEKKMKILYDRIHLRRFSFYYAFRFIRVDIFFKSKEKEGEKKKIFALRSFIDSQFQDMMFSMISTSIFFRWAEERRRNLRTRHKLKIKIFPKKKIHVNTPCDVKGVDSVIWIIANLISSGP